jgi:hypothetical protein
LAGQLDELLPDVREIDPNDNLPEQLMLRILDKIEDNIRNHFGDHVPYISPVINFQYWEWVFDSIIPPNGHWERKIINIPLGRIEINLDPFVNIVRNAIQQVDFYHTDLNNACFKLARVFAKELDLAAKQLLKEDRSSEKQRLESISREHSNSPKEIAILSPLSLSHYTNPIDVKIHLGGVPLSFLGIGKDEMQRVLVYINGELIPPKSLILEESRLGAKEESIHLKDFDFSNLVFIDNKTGEIRNSFDSKGGIISTSKARVITDTAVHYPIQKLRGQTANSGDQLAFTALKFKEYPISETTYGYPTKNHDSTKVYLERDTKAIEVKGKDKPVRSYLVHNYSIENILPGRGFSTSRVKTFLQDRIPGVFIHFKVPLDEPFIVEGVNVLTVVVIEKSGDRHQQNVSFTVSHDDIVLKPVPGVILSPGKGSGEIEKATISLNSLFEYFNKSEKKGSIGMHAYFESIGKRKVRKTVKPDQKETVQMSIRKNETIVVMQRDANGEEKRLGESFVIDYTSSFERRAKLIELSLDNRTLSSRNQRLKTETVSYVKPLRVLGKDNEEVKGVSQVSTFVRKEEVDILDMNGEPLESMTIEYSSDDERKVKLAVLEIDDKLIKTKNIETAEKVFIVGENGKNLHEYYRNSNESDINSDVIENYKMNPQEGIIGKYNNAKNNEIEVKNILLIDNYFDLDKRISASKEYLINQSKFNLINIL